MKALLSIALLTISATTTAEESFTFKGIPLGATTETVRAAFDYEVGCDRDRCSISPSQICSNRSNASCFGKFSYGGVLPKLIGFTFKEDKLQSVVVLFETRDFESLAAAMRERFGKPAMEEIHTLENRMGAKFESRLIAWTQGDSVIQIRQRAGRIDQGSVFLTTLSGVRERSEQKRDAAKAAAKDL